MKMIDIVMILTMNQETQKEMKNSVKNIYLFA